MKISIDKTRIFKAVVEALESSLKTLKAAAVEAAEASTNEESKAENKYDTRGLEASYLAQGQATRAKELEETLFMLKKVQVKSYLESEPIGISALVQLEDDEESRKWYFLVPAGGVTIETQGIKVQTTSLNSPMGAQLLDLSVGDELTIKNKEYEITAIL